MHEDDDSLPVANSRLPTECFLVSFDSRFEEADPTVILWDLGERQPTDDFVAVLDRPGQLGLEEHLWILVESLMEEEDLLASCGFLFPGNAPCCCSFLVAPLISVTEEEEEDDDVDRAGMEERSCVGLDDDDSDNTGHQDFAFSSEVPDRRTLGGTS